MDTLELLSEVKKLVAEIQEIDMMQSSEEIERKRTGLILLLNTTVSMVMEKANNEKLLRTR